MAMEHSAVDTTLQSGMQSNQELWIPMKRLLQHHQFLKCSRARSIGMTLPIRPPIPVFVSHRWHSLRNPDPDGYQYHVVIRFLVEAICLSRGLCKRFFTIGTYPVVNQRLQKIFSDLAPEWQAGEQKWRVLQDTGQFHIETWLKNWIASSLPGLFFEKDEIEEIAMCLERVGVWYDYSCMPQKPFQSDAEEEMFDWNLNNLNSLISSSHVLMAWDEESVDRAWCLYESIIAAQDEGFNVDITPNHPSKLFLDLGGSGVKSVGSKELPTKIRQRIEVVPGLEINLLESGVKSVGSEELATKIHQRTEELTGLETNEVENFLSKNRIQTALPGDLPRVARLISSYLAGVRQ